MIVSLNHLRLYVELLQNQILKIETTHVISVFLLQAMCRLLLLIEHQTVNLIYLHDFLFLLLAILKLLQTFMEKNYLSDFQLHCWLCSGLLQNNLYLYYPNDFQLIWLTRTNMAQYLKMLI